MDSREVEGGVAVGTYIRLHLEGVTRAAAGENNRGAGEGMGSTVKPIGCVHLVYYSPVCVRLAC